MTAPVDRSFPTVELDWSFGQWWRIHSKEHGPWFFGSSDMPGCAGASIGRFDLPRPHGTCYVGEYLDGAVPEVLREQGVTHAESQEAANARRLSQMALDRWYELPIADFTSPAVTAHGAPADVASVSRAEGRMWAEATRHAGFHGILYRLGQDPKHRRGLALFYEAGEHALPSQPSPICLPVGLRKDVAELFDGEYRGDPLPL
jgi:hypothetical protein